MQVAFFSVIISFNSQLPPIIRVNVLLFLMKPVLVSSFWVGGCCNIDVTMPAAWWRASTDHLGGWQWS